MVELEKKIVSEGEVLPGNVLKVGSFLNQMIDVDFVMKMGKEIADLFSADGVTKILTVESSGIAVAFSAGASMHVPVVFAKKNKTSNINSSCYSSVVHSFTHGNDSVIIVLTGV